MSHLPAGLPGQKPAFVPPPAPLVVPVQSRSYEKRLLDTISHLDDAPYIARASWYHARRLVMHSELSDRLLSEVEDPDLLLKTQPPPKDSLRSQWQQRLLAMAKDADVDQSSPGWSALLSGDPLGVYPSPNTLCLIEMSCLGEVIEMMTEGISRIQITKTLSMDWHLPFFFVGEVLRLADRAADLMTKTSKGVILAGMESDLRAAKDEGDVRARIAARKNIAQATGALATASNKTPTEEAIDVLREIAKMAKPLREIEEAD